MISDEIGLTIMNECDFDDYVFANPHNVTVRCTTAISEANQIVGEYINNYDVILDVCYPSIVQQELRLRKMVSSMFLYYLGSIFLFHLSLSCNLSFDCCNEFFLQSHFLQATKISLGVDVCMSSERRFYFNLPEVQKALHANRTNLPYSWSMCSK